MEFRDDKTGEHIKRIGKYCVALAKALGLPSERQKELFYASSMHDMGKIGVPDYILFKAGPLSPEEFEMMKQHTIIGARILSGSQHPILKLAEVLAVTHHERWDGKGYPHGLIGEEIPLEGRICALADFFDACTSPRVYRPPLDYEDVLAMIREESGKHFDPRVVQTFFDILPEILAIHKEGREGNSCL